MENMELQWINADKGIARFSGHKEMFVKFLQKFPTKNDCDGLKAAMEAQDYTEAFARAHALKGEVGNLSLDRLYNEVDIVVEGLRNGVNIPKAVEEFPVLYATYEETLKHIAAFEA